MNKVDKTCVECNINKGSRSTYFNVYLCTECRMNGGGESNKVI